MRGRSVSGQRAGLDCITGGAAARLASAWLVLALGALGLAFTGGAGAARAADFYAGRQITLIVGSAPGGGYDQLGRLMARHLPRFIPGTPVIVVQNMPAAGSIAAANTLYNISARDGTVLGLMQRGILLAPFTNPAGVHYDLARFGWLGSLNSETGVVFAMASAPFKTAQDLFERELMVGANNNVDPEISPRLYNALIGTRFKIVTGYPGTPSIQLAMERGEVQGIGDWSWSSFKHQKPEWLTEHKIVPLMQGALQRNPELADLPNALEFARNETDRRVLELYFAQKTVARPVLAPPGLPADRLALLRAGFARLAHDEAFLSDAEKQKIEAAPIAGEEVDKVIGLVTAQPTEVVARFKAALAGK